MVIRFQRDVVKSLQKLDPTLRKIIEKKLLKIHEEKISGKPLRNQYKGFDTYYVAKKYRIIGQWMSEDEFFVLKINHRQDVY